METRINVTGMQGDRLIIQTALPDLVRELPHNWKLTELCSAIALLKTGRSNKAKRAAVEVLERKLGRSNSVDIGTAQQQSAFAGAA
jgi:hypothetical protein